MNRPFQFSMRQMFGVVALFCAAAWLLAILWRNNLISVLLPLGVGGWIGGGLGAADDRPIRGAIIGALAFLAVFGGLWAILYLVFGGWHMHPPTGP